MDFITAVLTITTMNLIARRKWYGWAVGLVNQVFWGILCIQKQMHWMLMVVFILTIQYSITLIRWKRYKYYL